jgi:hypothetical protein
MGWQLLNDPLTNMASFAILAMDFYTVSFA